MILNRLSYKFFKMIYYLPYTEKTNSNVKNMPLMYGLVGCSVPKSPGTLFGPSPPLTVTIGNEQQSLHSKYIQYQHRWHWHQNLAFVFKLGWNYIKLALNENMNCNHVKLKATTAQSKQHNQHAFNSPNKDDALISIQHSFLLLV